MKVFVSYSRVDGAAASCIEADVRAMDHMVWYDREIAGGHAWWREILGQIRACEVFVFVMTKRSLESQACRSELAYAQALQRTILPVLSDDEVRVNLLPPELAAVNYVDYRSQDKQAALALAKALMMAPPARALPELLPAEPPTPMSYLGTLCARLDSPAEMALSEQRDMLFEIRKRIKDAGAREDAMDLLRSFRRRDELLASVAQEIDLLLAAGPTEIPTQKAAGPVASPQPPGDRRVSSPPPVEIALLPSAIAMNSGDPTDELHQVVRQVLASGARWDIKVGDDSLAISLEGESLVLEACLHHWTESTSKALVAAGWIPPADHMKAVVAGAFSLLGVATSGLSLGLLLHKGTRRYLTKTVLVRRLPRSDSAQAAEALQSALRLLSPQPTRLIAAQTAAAGETAATA
jgi:hypothetical protein